MHLLPLDLYLVDPIATSVLDTMAMKPADVASNHYLVRSTNRLIYKLNRVPVTKNTKKKLELEAHKLQNDIHRRFNIQLKNRFQALAVEEQMTDERREEDEVDGKSEKMEKAYVKSQKRY